MSGNTVELTGTLTHIDPLRHTPAGLPIAGFRLLHQSQQMEAGYKRQVECEVAGMAIGPMAKELAGMPTGTEISARGFLDRKNRMSTQLTLHVTNIESVKGKNHG
jgi:primosomal replication protein N